MQLYKKKHRGTHLYSRWACKQGSYIQNNIFVGKWMGLYPGGLEPGGWALKWDFMVCKALKKKTSY